VSVIVQRSFLLGRSVGAAVSQEQRDTLDRLAEHDLFVAGLALARGTGASYNDFMTMRSLMLAGGLHRVRLFGGRGIDR
jgi:hypothetical protein